MNKLSGSFGVAFQALIAAERYNLAGSMLAAFMIERGGKIRSDAKRLDSDLAITSWGRKRFMELFFPHEGLYFYSLDCKEDEGFLIEMLLIFQGTVSLHAVFRVCINSDYFVYLKEVGEGVYEFLPHKRGQLA